MESFPYSDFATIWYSFHRPHCYSDLTQKTVFIIRCAKTHFGENQLAAISISFSNKSFIYIKDRTISSCKLIYNENLVYMLKFYSL